MGNNEYCWEGLFEPTQPISHNQAPDHSESPGVIGELVERRHMWSTRYRPDRSRLASIERTLYFAGGGLDERQMVYYLETEKYDPAGHAYLVSCSDLDAHVIRVNGQTFVVRQMAQHVLFRAQTRLPAEDMLFLPDTSVKQFA